MPARSTGGANAGVIENLSAAAPVRPLNPLIPLGRYYRTAALLERQVRWPGVQCMAYVTS